MKYFTNLNKFYNSKEWDECKKYILSQRMTDKGEVIDEHTGKPIYKKYDMVFHHKIELTLANVNDPDISLNPDNIMIVSFKSHNEIHNRFGSYQKKIIMVHGNICSGKSSFVRKNAGKNDIILDMDNIWQMVSINDRYIKPNTLKSLVFSVRACMLDQIKMRNGMWSNAWIITTSPYPMERKRMIENVGVDEVIHIDTPLEDCISNLYNDEARRNVVEEYEKYIREYDNNFQL